MSTKEKKSTPAPVKYDSLEKAEAAYAEAKKTASDARGNLDAFLNKNKLKRATDYSSHKDHGAEYSKLKKAQGAAIKARNDIEEAMKDLKPKKEREVKYEYPADFTAADKKKFRAEQRRKNAQKDKPEKVAKPAKKEEKKTKEVAPAAPVASKKKEDKKPAVTPATTEPIKKVVKKKKSDD